MTRDRIPEDMTLDKAAEFWDEHSFLDYDDVQEVHFSIDLRKNSNYVALNGDLARQIRIIAHQKGTSPSLLVNQWLKEKILAEGHPEG